jgi:hypothetical protein
MQGFRQLVSEELPTSMRPKQVRQDVLRLRSQCIGSLKKTGVIETRKFSITLLT